MEISPAAASTYSKLLPVVFRIDCLLSLCLGNSVEPRKTLGVPERPKEGVAPELQPILNQVEILHPGTPSGAIGKPRHPMDQLVPWVKMQPRLERAFSAHFAAFDKLAPAYQMYFATLRRSGLYLEHSFLSIMMAIETFDRCRRGGKYVDDGQWNVLRPLIEAHIPAGTDNGLRESLTTRLKYANEYTLRQRLRCLAKEWAGLFDHLGIDTARWANLVVNTRNDLVHESRVRPDTLDVVGGLYGLVQTLRALVEGMLMTEMGFSLDEATNLLRESSRFTHLRGIWKAQT